MKQCLVKYDADHHQLMMFDQHTHLCMHWFYAHMSTVLELGTCAVHCEQQSSDLFVLVYMKQQLMSWDLQHIARSFLLQRTQILVLLADLH